MILSARGGALHDVPAFDVSAGKLPNPAAGTILEGMFTPAFEAAWDASASKAPKGSLDNRGAVFPQDQAREEVERTSSKTEELQGANRWRLKAKVRRLLRPTDGTRGPSVCGCGAVGMERDPDGNVKPKEAVTVHRRKSGAGVSGTFRCDSPWLCPSCAPARAMRRKERVKAVIDNTQSKGGSVAFVTLTISHNIYLRLADAKKVVSEASRRARQGRKWMAIKAKGQILGVVQGVEALHNKRTGWHYHLHLVVPGMGKRSAVLEAAEELRDRYLEEVAKLGAKALIEGQDVQIIKLNDKKIGQYASKGSAAWEVAGGAKKARSVMSRTPWHLVTLAALGDEQAAALFREYAEVMPGTRSCVISPALAEALGIESDEDDDDPGVQQLDEGDEIVGEITGPVWGRLWGRGKAWMILKAVEKRMPWERVAEMADRYGAEITAPRRIELLDVRRVVAYARSRRGGHAAKSQHIDEAIAIQKREAERRGRILQVRDDVERKAIQREFIRQGLDAVL